MSKWCQELLNKPTIILKIIKKIFYQEENFNTSHLKRAKDSMKKIASKTLQLKNTVTEDQGADSSKGAVLVHWKKSENSSQVHTPCKKIL